MLDVQAQRLVQDKLRRMKEAKEKALADEEKSAHELKAELERQKNSKMVQGLKEQQRREVYALNREMAKLENDQFVEFMQANKDLLEAFCQPDAAGYGHESDASSDVSSGA